MIRRIRLLRNIGQFDSVDAAATIALRRFVLIYAENGRGKTTLAAVLRSLATGDPVPITERRRLAAAHSPHVVLDCDGGPPDAMFQDGAWNRTLSHLALFDDVFVDANIHSGLAVDARHRQNLHELVLGARGVALSRKLQELVSRIEEHNRALREKAAAIAQPLREGFSVDDFCVLPHLAGVDAEIEATERALAAARDQDAVRTSALFGTLGLPAFDVAAIDRILERDLPDLDAAAEAHVRTHVATLGAGGEQWVGDGNQRLPRPEGTGPCPFCGQDLASSLLIAHYQAYFSAAYGDLKRAVTGALESVRRAHAGDVSAGFERAIRVAGEQRVFWSRFCDVPEIGIDTAAVVRDWNAAREAVIAALAAKQASPLERQALDRHARNAIAAYDMQRQHVAEVSDALIAANDSIRVVQEQAAGANPDTIARDLARLRATSVRHAPETASLCADYLMEKEAKACTEQERAEARSALDGYRANAFPASQTAINVYLRRFNAGFRMDSVTSTSTRGGLSCTYNVVINDTAVSVGGASMQGEPSFRNTLSSGDRNTLALAFFFASLDQDPILGRAVVVIDDPITSLDDHRSLTTVQEVRRLAERAGQVIVLSHDKRFLCRIWNGADPTTRLALEIARDGKSSTLRPWDVAQDSVTEHDRRHERLREYVATGNSDQRETARAIRPHLEAFLRVACPGHFPPGTLLGPFLGTCRQRVGHANEVLDRGSIQELGALIEYANRFHHDTNPAWETEVINDAELRDFVERALVFARR
ncbi:AAA family ATPase [Myxococcota bacterium]|nr:AAA family ATPase [Myxococcota bacterium]MCZ7617595.1 AAA family ATPase [Myxococcota bacterium]